MSLHSLAFKMLDEVDRLRTENAALRQAFGEAWQQVEARQRDVIGWRHGVELFYEEGAIAELLDDDVLFANSRKYLCTDGSTRPDTMVLFVNCNDVFAWACCDAEEVAMRELRALYTAWTANRTWGPARWCCIKRNQKPQRPVEQAMREAGAWDDVMDALPENEYDRRCREAEGGR